jgi:hypothetical protein
VRLPYPFRRPAYPPRRPHRSGLAAPGALNVAFVIPRSGPAGMFGPSCELSARLAAEELNAADGVGGKQLGGAFLAFYVFTKVGPALADEPIQQYEAALRTFIAPAALGVGVFFVVMSQIKINVTNAYSGSLSWSNFFSRILHWHPGRVVWIFLNVGIALTLMEANVFSFLNNILGFYSNVAIAWIGAVCADLVIIKPLGLSPSFIEFKRAHLYNFNPVGFGSMMVASIVSIIAFYNAFGADAKAFSPLIALVIAARRPPPVQWTWASPPWPESKIKAGESRTGAWFHSRHHAPVSSLSPTFPASAMPRLC